MSTLLSPAGPGARAPAPPSRVRVLTRHFFRRFFENDLISPSGDGVVGLSHLLAAFVTPGLLVVILVMLKYALVHTTWARVVDLGIDDGLLYVALSMIVLGIAATVTWDAFFLDARDHFVLGVLPVGHRVVALAKLGALAMFLAVFASAANLVPTLLVPSLMLQRAYDATVLGHVLPLTAAHGAATILSGAWTVLAIVALRGAMAACLPGRWLRSLAPVAQGGLILVLLAWFVSLPQFLANRPAVMAGGGWARDASPPMWFLGLYETMIGQPQPVWHHLARTALWATAAVAAAVVVLVFALPARRQSELAGAVAGPGRARVGAALPHRLAAVLSAHPRSRASFAFTAAGLGRSANHRIYLAGAVGAGLAWSFSGVFWEFGRSGAAGLALPNTLTLSVQPTLVLFLVVAIRFAITIPLALPANWIVRLTESRTVGDDHAGVRAVALVVGLLIVAVLAPFHASLWRWDIAAYHTMFGVLYVFAVVSLFFGVQNKYPFAAPYISGSLKLKSRWLHYLFGLSALTTAPAFLELQVFRYGRRALLLPAVLAAACWALAAWRRRREAELPGHKFDEVPDDACQALDLFM
jgi:hypothetical protein